MQNLQRRLVFTLLVLIAPQSFGAEFVADFKGGRNTTTTTTAEFLVNSPGCLSSATAATIDSSWVQPTVVGFVIRTVTEYLIAQAGMTGTQAQSRQFFPNLTDARLPSKLSP